MRTFRLLWILSLVMNTVVAICFAIIAYTVFDGLKRSGQLRTNLLGTATAAMFASCAISHESHAFHMLMPFFGIEQAEGLAMRRSVVWHLDLVDAVTMGVAIWYLTQRPKFKSLLDGGELFADLQRRYNDQTRALENKGRVADVLQRALAPKELPVASAVAFDATYRPADNHAAIGGDWYDVFTLPDGRIAFSIGDVTGHGLDAAAATSRAREAIAAAAFANESPSVVLASVNRIMVQRSSAIVTAIYGTIEPQTLRLRYATAGHPPPVIAFRDEPARFAGYDGLPLGVEIDARFRTFDMLLRRGALVVVYTDGVTEFDRDMADGERRLLAAVTRHAARSTPAPSGRILDEVLAGARSRDDIALLAMKFIGEPVVRDTPTCREWTFDVKDPEAATRLRHEIMAALRRESATSDDFAAELIVGELLGNVVKHTPGIIVASLDWSGTAAVLAVEDQGRGFVANPALPDDVYSLDGRGMFLVSTLARSVRHERLVPAGSRLEVVLPSISTKSNGATYSET